jgi:hypothetical protein
MLRLTITTRVRRWVLVTLPLWILPLVFALVLRSGPTPAPYLRAAVPHESWQKERCTWYCHNRGCTHSAVLPSVLSDDLFFWTVGRLHAVGNAIAQDGFAGYRAANLIVFCFVWPAGMYVLYVIAIAQRERIRRLRRDLAKRKGT